MIVTPVSLLDTDLYKLTMQQAVRQLFPNEVVGSKFINRGNIKFSKNMVQYLKESINCLSYIRLGKDEKKFLSEKCPYLTPAYLDFLEGYTFDPNEIKIECKNGYLEIFIIGLWYRIILWEVPLLSMISELYYKSLKIQPTQNYETRRKYIIQKGIKLSDINCYYSEFGTRRRFSFDNQSTVIGILHAGDFERDFSPQNLTGTSNLYFAKTYNLKPVGTMAHEWIMFHAAKYGYKIANTVAMNNWVKVYKGDLGIALTDTFTSYDFFKQFDIYQAKLFDGVRQDSGDPIDFIKMAVQKYKSLGIPLSHKTILFSDALNLKKIKRIKKFLVNNNLDINDRYGIGTWLSNDLEGIDPLNIVIKLDWIQDRDSHRINSAVKLSDDVGKATGRKDDIKLCEQTLGLRI